MRLRGVVVLLGVAIMLAVPSVAGAARSGVTIHHKNRFQFYGYVFSPDSNRCARFRNVRLFKQVGKEQNRRRDIKVSRECRHRQGGEQQVQVARQRTRFRAWEVLRTGGQNPRLQAGQQQDDSRSLRGSPRTGLRE